MRVRVRGLARNPAVHGDLLRRVLDRPECNRFEIMSRKEWTDEALDTVATHPDPKIRAALARACLLSGVRRARLVDDESDEVRAALAEGPYVRWHQPLPLPAYQRLAADSSAYVRCALTRAEALPHEVMVMLSHDRDHDVAELASLRLRPSRPAPLTRQDAEARAADDNQGERAEIAAHPDLPADLAAMLAVDESPYVRLAVSMRPELTEAQRAAIDYHVAPWERLSPALWAVETEDPRARHSCVHSAHIGLRRSVAYNRHLSPEHIEVLAGDDDFAVRLLLCENHVGVPGKLVLRTYLEARFISRADLLLHPAFPRTDLARLAESADWQVRKLVPLDPGAPAELIERLSHDEHPGGAVLDGRRPAPVTRAGR